MAILCDTNNQYIKYSTDPFEQTPFTTCFWIRRTNATTWDVFYNKGSVEYPALMWNGSGNPTEVRVYDIPGGSVSSQYQHAHNQWIHITFQRWRKASNSFPSLVLINGGEDWINWPATSLNYNSIHEYGGGWGTYCLHGEMAAIKTWQSVLTLEEIQAEMWQIVPAKKDNLIIFNPCTKGNLTRNWAWSEDFVNAGIAPTYAADPPGVVWDRASLHIQEIGLLGIVAAGTPLSISIAENLALTENINMAMEALAGLSLSISETIGVSEFRSMAMPLGSISVTEDIGATESIGESMPLAAITGVDNLTVAETLQLLKDLVPSVFENVGISEFIQILKEVVGISLAENVGLAENLQAAIDGAAIVSGEDVGVAQFIAAALELIASIQEDVGIVEAISVILDLLKSAAETIALTEDIQIAIEGVLAGISKVEAIALIENIDLLLEEIIGTISRSETISISESVSAALENAGISVVDAIGVVEAITAILPITISISDLIGISEYILINLESGINVSDAINITESIAIQFDKILLEKVENITIGEWLNVVVSGIVGKITAEFSFTRPGASFNFKRPGATFTLH